MQVQDSSDRDRLRFGLTAEGGLNDGAAFPVVILALGLLGLYDFGDGWRWLAVDVVWAIAGGLGIGGALGILIGCFSFKVSIDVKLIGINNPP